MRSPGMWVGRATVFCGIWLIAAFSAGSADIPKFSAIVPAEDLIQQVDFFIGRVAQSLIDFDLAEQSRTVKDANTLAALGLVLAAHDQGHPLKGSMPRLVRAAQALAEAGDSLPKAQAAFAEIQAARAATDKATEPVKWEKSAALAPLMKQVPLVHNGLKRSVEPRNFQRQAVQSAGQAATLAAIAQAALLDPEYATSPENARRWTELCAQMRDAAGEVNSAVHAKDQQRLTAGMKRLSESCETCHAQFRRPQ